MPSEVEVLHELKGSSIFTKLDAAGSYWQVPLTEGTQLLTKFITPVGRFCFNGLLFGISSATEHFERRMQQILHGIPGVICKADDVIIDDQVEGQEGHDLRLLQALERLNAAGVSLNEKCVISQPAVDFWGSRLNKDGITALQERTQAIAEMPTPTNVNQVRRFLGMANQLGKFKKDLAETTTPLRKLLSKEAAWHWDVAQQQSFDAIKQLLCSTDVLTLYDANRETIVSADASAHGVRAAILQIIGGVSKPVAYASRSLSSTEQ